MIRKVLSFIGRLLGVGVLVTLFYCPQIFGVLFISWVAYILVVGLTSVVFLE